MHKFTVSILASVFSASSLWAQTADMVFTNASVLTMNDDAPTAEAVAVAGNRIVYVGETTGAQAWIGSGTETFDLEGKSLLPGFVSGHDHLVASGWTQRGVSLFGVETIEAAQQKIKSYANSHPNEDFVFGYGFNRVAFGRWPTLAELDAVVPDRPALILDNTIHDAWLNSRMFEAGEVPDDDPDQVPGTIYWQRDDAGNMTGIGIEFQWFPAMIRSGGWSPEEDIPPIQQRYYAEAVKTGMTAVHVPGLAAPGATDQKLAASEMEVAMAYLHEMEQQGRLSMRTFVANIFKTPQADPSEVAEHTQTLRERYNSDMLQVWGIKIHPEGNWSSKTSLMLEAYEDSDTQGGAAVRGAQIAEVHLEANKRGLPVGTHVDGSLTVRDTIDAILGARNAGHFVPNNQLEHYFWVTDADHKRVIENQIMVNTTPQFMTDWEGQDKNALALLGKARVEAQFARYSDLMRRGHNVSISADIPSSPLDMIAPLFSVEIAMTLQDPTNPSSRPFPPGQNPASLEEALKAITVFPAEQQNMQDKIGSIEVGKLADLVVLDQDIREVAVHDISDIKVLGTIMDGRFTHRDGM